MTDALHVAHDYQTAWEDEPETPGVRWRNLISGDRTPSHGLNVGVFEVLPGGELAPHHHAPQEVYYVVAGQAEIHRDGVWKPFARGDVAYIPGGTVHGVRNRGDEAITVVWAFPTDTYDEVEYIDD